MDVPAEFLTPTLHNLLNPLKWPTSMNKGRQASDNSKDEVIIILEVDEDSSINKNLSGQQFRKR